jgi:hypothetical protein
MSAVEVIVLQNSLVSIAGLGFEFWRLVGRAPRCGVD